MKYHIHLNYKNGGSYTALKVDKALFEKLKESLVDDDYGFLYYASDLWWDCEGEGYGACEEPWRDWCWVGDSLNCVVTDEHNKTVCVMQHIESRQMPGSDSKRVHRYGDGLWFELSFTYKSYREEGPVFSLELDNEEFDPNKLYFKEHNEDIFKDCLYINALSYEGGKIEFEEDNSAEDYYDGNYDETSSEDDAYLIAVKGDKIKLVEISSVDELEKLKSLVTGYSDEQTENEMRSNSENCNIFQEEKAFIEGETPTSFEYCGIFNEGLAAVKKNGKWGFVDTTGKIVVPVEYDQVGAFCDGLVMVEKNRKRGFVDTTGKIVVPVEYNQVGAFCGGLVMVEKKSMMGVMDKSGKVIVPVEYDDVEISDGLVRVTTYDKHSDYNFKHGLVDKSGKVILPVEYDEILFLEEGLIMVEKNGKQGFVDKTGKAVVSEE